MKIVLNGNETEVKENISVYEMLELFGFTPELVALERNKDVLPRASWNSEVVKSGDIFEVVHFVGGG